MQIKCNFILLLHTCAKVFEMYWTLGTHSILLIIYVDILNNETKLKGLINPFNPEEFRFYSRIQFIVSSVFIFICLMWYFISCHCPQKGETKSTTSKQVRDSHHFQKLFSTSSYPYIRGWAKGGLQVWVREFISVYYLLIYYYIIYFYDSNTFAHLHKVWSE